MVAPAVASVIVTVTGACKSGNVPGEITGVATTGATSVPLTGICVADAVALRLFVDKVTASLNASEPLPSSTADGLKSTVTLQKAYGLSLK